jgi:hypothetical protein
MTADPLRIEFRKIGAGFYDGPCNRGTFEKWAILMCHPSGQEFVLAVGEKDVAIADTITRVETILANLKKQL